jgi:hypothetical protein
MDANLASCTFDSRLRGVMSMEGQYDIRQTGGVDNIVYSALGAWFGTDETDPAEFTAVPDVMKTAASVIAYFERGDTAWYPGFYLTGPIIEVGTPPPYTDAHDSRQAQDLADAIEAAGLPYDMYIWTAGDLTNTGWTGATPVDPSATVQARYQTIHNVLKRMVGG